MNNQQMPEKTLIEEVVDNLVTRMDTLESTEIKIPDYSDQFKAIENLIKVSSSDYKKPIEELKNTVKQHSLEYPTEQIQNQLNEVKGMVTNLPKVLPVRHSIDIKGKGLITAVVCTFLFVACLSGLSIHLWTANDRLKANDLKYRSIRQMSPEWTHWADTTYSRNSEAMEKSTVKLENDALEKAEAEAIASQKEEEAKAAKKRLKDLKKKK